MLGAIIGDVVGSCYEFNNTRDFGFELFPSGCNFTDDTILTVAVAEWLLSDKKLSAKGLEEILVDFAHRYPNPMGGYGGGFERWAFSPETLVDYRTGEPAKERMPYNSWGNGSAMRVSAVGWMFDTLEQTERVAGISAAVTHNHPEGIKGAQAAAVAIFLARTGHTKVEIRAEIERRYGYDLSMDWETLHRTYDWDSSCQGTVPQALVAFLQSTDFESAIRMAVAMGGDSDTLACITGGIAEAFYQRISGRILLRVLELLPAEFTHLIERLAKAGAYGEYWRAHSFGIAKARLDTITETFSATKWLEDDSDDDEDLELNENWDDEEPEEEEEAEWEQIADDWEHQSRSFVTFTYIPLLMSRFESRMIDLDALTDFDSWEEELFSENDGEKVADWDKMTATVEPLSADYTAVFYRFWTPMRMPEPAFAAVVFHNETRKGAYYTLELSVDNQYVHGGVADGRIYNYGLTIDPSLEGFKRWILQRMKIG